MALGCLQFLDSVQRHGKTLAWLSPCIVSRYYAQDPPRYQLTLSGGVDRILRPCEASSIAHYRTTCILTSCQSARCQTSTPQAMRTMPALMSFCSFSMIMGFFRWRCAA